MYSLNLQILSFSPNTHPPSLCKGLAKLRLTLSSDLLAATSQTLRDHFQAVVES